MSIKKWCGLTLGPLILFFLLCIVLIARIDPFQAYHLATQYLPPIDKTSQVYSNPGIARNYPYDSAIVGTSVTENFHPSYMNSRLGGQFIKLCTSAGTVHNHAVLLDIAFRTHTLRRIVYGLDVYSLVGESNGVAYPLPEYLYTDTFIDDAPYWFNKSVWGTFIPKCLKTWGQTQDESFRDKMYNWANQDEYSVVALEYTALFESPKQVHAQDAFLEKARNNIETNLLPFIKAHPETHFDIFFPPYSAAEWSNMESKGTLEALLALRPLCYDLLSPYENVALYDFSVRETWVLHGKNYKDTTHYGEWINDAITDCIAGGEEIVTAQETLLNNNDTLRTWAHALHDAGRWIFESD